MDNLQRIRVLIADDHTVLRKGIAFSLLPVEDLDVVGEASTGEEAILRCQALAPDVVIMDLRMPGMGVSQLRASCARPVHRRR